MEVPFWLLDSVLDKHEFPAPEGRFAERPLSPAPLPNRAGLGGGVDRQRRAHHRLDDRGLVDDSDWPQPPELRHRPNCRSVSPSNRRTLPDAAPRSATTSHRSTVLPATGHRISAALGWGEVRRRDRARQSERGGGGECDAPSSRRWATEDCSRRVHADERRRLRPLRLHLAQRPSLRRTAALVCRSEDHGSLALSSIAMRVGRRRCCSRSSAIRASKSAAMPAAVAAARAALRCFTPVR